MSYLDPSLIADDATNAESALAGVADRIPGWQPSNNHPETVMAETWGIALATAVAVFRDELANAYLGLADILNVQRVAASPAYGTTTWTFPSGQVPVTIPGGTGLTGTAPDGSSVDYAVTEDTVVPINPVSGVPVIAIEPGPEMNGISGEMFTGELNAVTIFLESPTGGGTDEEDLQEFLGKLQDRARRLRLLPITPADFAAFALDVPGIYRAYPVNRLNPSAPGVDSPNDVTIYAVDSDGAAVGTGPRQALIDRFGTGERVASTAVYVGVPGYANTHISVELVADASADIPSLKAAVSAAIHASLDSGAFDYDEDSPFKWKYPATRTLTAYGVAHTFDDIPGVRQITSITLNGLASVDLPEPLTLPRITALDVNISQ